jgi:hypothetical protein
MSLAQVEAKTACSAKTESAQGSATSPPQTYAKTPMKIVERMPPTENATTIPHSCIEHAPAVVASALPLRVRMKTQIANIGRPRENAKIIQIICSPIVRSVAGSVKMKMAIKMLMALNLIARILWRNVPSMCPRECVSPDRYS